jgi:hypothetical protein
MYKLIQPMYIIQLLICINLSMFPLVQSPLWNFGLTSVRQKQVPLCINLDKSLKHNVYQIVPEDYFASIVQECKYHAHSVVFVVSTRTEHLLLSLWLTCLIIHQLCFIPQTEYMRQQSAYHERSRLSACKKAQVTAVSASLKSWDSNNAPPSNAVTHSL